MRQLINNIKCRRWYSNIPCPIGQLNNIWALQIRIPFEPLLQSGMIDRIIHYTREKMQLHWHTVQSRLQMMIPYIITYHKMLLGIFRYLFTACIHPNIYIPRISGICIRIHQGIPLSFQNAAPHPILSQYWEELARHSIHLHILSANLLRLTHPSHQQFPPYRVLLQLLRILLPQSLYTLKAKPQQSLLRSKRIQLIPAIILLIFPLYPRQHFRKAKIAVISFIQLLIFIKLLILSHQFTS